MTELDPVLTLREAAAAIGIHRVTLTTWLREGRGPPVVRFNARKVGVRQSDLQAFIDSHVIQPGAAAPPSARRVR